MAVPAVELQIDGVLAGLTGALWRLTFATFVIRTEVKWEHRSLHAAFADMDIGVVHCTPFDTLYPLC
jgi:hypothetical protein